MVFLEFVRVPYFFRLKKPGIHLQIAIQSAKMFKNLEEELDYDIEYTSKGAMVVIPDQIQFETMRLFVEEQCKNGLKVILLNREEAKTRESALADTIIGATYCYGDGQVNPMRLTYGFAETGKKFKKAKILSHVNVIGINRIKNKIEGVVTGQGNIKTGMVINAAGAYAPQIGMMVGLNIPIIPRRGQDLVSEEAKDIVKGIICTSNYIGYKYNQEITDSNGANAGLLVEPTASGNYLIGATREFVGYNSGVTYSGIKSIASNAVSSVPALIESFYNQEFCWLKALYRGRNACFRIC